MRIIGIDPKGELYTYLSETDPLISCGSKIIRCWFINYIHFGSCFLEVCITYWCFCFQMEILEILTDMQECIETLFLCAR